MSESAEKSSKQRRQREGGVTILSGLPISQTYVRGSAGSAHWLNILSADTQLILHVASYHRLLLASQIT